VYGREAISHLQGDTIEPAVLNVKLKSALLNIKTYAKGRKLFDIFFFKYRPKLTLEIKITYKYSKELHHYTCCVNKV
jgi:hypothetical protein